jgi:hypothetical protein
MLVQLTDAEGHGLLMIKRFFAKGEMIAGCLFLLKSVLPERQLLEKWPGRIVLAAATFVLFTWYYAPDVPSLVYFWCYGLSTTALLTLNIIGFRKFSPESRLLLFIISCVASFFVPELAKNAAWLMTHKNPTLLWLLPFSSVHFLCFSSIYLLHDIAQLKPQLSSLTSLSHALSPVKFIAEMPLPVVTLPETAADGCHMATTSAPVALNDQTVTARAVLSLIGSVAALLIAWMFFHIGIEDHVLGFFSRGLRQYIFYYLAWLGITRCSYAGALILGYRLEPVTRFALLATSPLDRWKRWNLYYYDWFLLYIFLPVSRKTRSLTFGVVAVFALNFIIHNTGLLTAFMLRPASFGQHGLQLVINEFEFYFLQGFAVFLGFRFPNIWPKSDRRIAWLGNMATTFLMILTHSVLYLS